MGSIGAQIRKAREARGMSQKALSIALGKTQPTVSDWERDKHVPPVEEIRNVAQILGVSSAQLLAEPAPRQQSAPLTIAVVPVIGDLLADRPFDTSNVVGYVPYPPEADPRGVFAHVLKWDIADRAYRRGDTLFLAPNAAVRPGSRILGVSKGTVTMWQVDAEGNAPESPEVRVLGPLVGLFRPL